MGVGGCCCSKPGAILLRVSAILLGVNLPEMMLEVSGLQIPGCYSNEVGL